MEVVDAAMSAFFSAESAVVTYSLGFFSGGAGLAGQTSSFGLRPGMGTGIGTGLGSKMGTGGLGTGIGLGIGTGLGTGIGTGLGAEFGVTLCITHIHNYGHE